MVPSWGSAKRITFVACAALATCNFVAGLSTPTTSMAPPPSKTTVGAVTTVPSSLNQAELDAKKFPRTWVPVASAFELDPDRPSPIEFLGQKYIAYQDNSKNWVVMDDVCPHRLVPLSEGRIDRETDSVQCSYHGWSFDSTGSCISIPQMSGDTMETALNSKRSCVASYPTHVEKNIIFMWPWKEDVLSVANNPQACPEGILEHLGDDPSTYTRDLPYGWDSLVENLIDPAHVPFAHHGMQGSRKDAIPINMTKPTEINENGFSFYWEDRTIGQMRSGGGHFKAPYVVAYDAAFKPKDESGEKRPFALTAVCIPTKPGWSRAIIASGPPKKKEEENNMPEKQTKKKKKKKPLAAKLFSKMPTWLIHQLSNRFLDSDLAFLHFQERERQRSDNYFMPSASDRCISALRSWIPQYTDIFEGQVLPPSPARSILFDRNAQHTSQCKHCQKGLESIQKWRRAAYATLAVSIFGFKFKMAKASTLLCLGALRLMQKLEQSFKEGEFKHYENH